MRKKLIEVSLPLEAINVESAREKSIRHGHPSTLHLWWSRKPTATARAVLWASLVDDPSSWPDKFPTEEDQRKERERLFDILGRIEIEVDKKGNQKQVVRGLVSWDDIKDEKIIHQAQIEIARCLAWERGEEPPKTPEAVREYIAKYAPPAYDPFAGGGSIPLEAQRLGLEAHASDLNPVAVLINKALIEIPPKFKNLPPINPEDRKRAKLESWQGAQGLAADVRFYGSWMREKALEKIGHLYPSCPSCLRGEEEKELTVIAWLWARTVKCPNPACGCEMPLVNKFELSTKKGKEAWVEYENHKDTKDTKVRFTVKTGKGKAPEGTVSRKGAVCVACGTPVGLDYVRGEGKAGRMGQQLMAIAAEGDKGRIYLSPTEEHEKVAKSAIPKWKPSQKLADDPRNIWCVSYGLDTFDKLFTNRQLVALTTFCDLVSEAKDRAIQDAISAGLADDDVPLNDGGTGARAYGEAVATYLGFSINKSSDYWSNICTWHISGEKMSHVFTRQAIPMAWDFAEANPMSDSSGNFIGAINWICKVIEASSCNANGIVTQHDATASHENDEIPKVISTDPPYYDNIGYADLADFFYVWLRRSLGAIYPDICNTLLVPKSQELVATPYRFGGSKQKAQAFFEEGLGKTFQRLNTIANAGYPVTIYYAFKQAETEQKGKADESVASTGWETMLEGLVKSGFSINGTWPMRSELSNRMVGQGTNALASSIVLVCRPRPKNAPKISRRQFLSEMQRELPKALKTLQQGNIAPVDLAQASIGPGMAIYSQYTAILENDGTALPVRTALQLINQLLDEFLTEQEGEFDPDTRWALTWFEQNQFNEGLYGDAETLSKAKNTSVQGLVTAGILEAKAGKVRLLQRHELKPDWNPETDSRTPDWEITQQLIHTLDKKGEIATASLLSQLGDKAEIARDLAYRLYNLCDRKGWTNEALAYNSLVIAWPEIQRLSNNLKSSPGGQLGLF
jgi:putative DNA methylase